MFCSGGAPLPHSGPASQGSLYQQRPGAAAAVPWSPPARALSSLPHLMVCLLSTHICTGHIIHCQWPHLLSLLFTSNFFILREQNLKTSLI